MIEMTEKPYYYDRALDKIKNRETGDDYWFLCDIADLLNKQDKIIKDKEKLIKAKNQQLEDVKRILYKFQDYNHDLIESILNELGWDSE